jgi:cytochrome c oxidase subunit 4
MSHDNHEASHTASYKSLGLVLGALLVLTVATVGAAKLQLPESLHSFHTLISLTIASLKASLVLWYFMHLKYEPPSWRWFFLLSVAILGVFIGLTIVDVAYR